MNNSFLQNQNYFNKTEKSTKIYLKKKAREAEIMEADKRRVKFSKCDWENRQFTKISQNIFIQLRYINYTFNNASVNILMFLVANIVTSIHYFLFKDKCICIIQHLCCVSSFLPISHKLTFIIQYVMPIYYVEFSIMHN